MAGDSINLSKVAKCKMSTGQEPYLYVLYTIRVMRVMFLNLLTIFKADFLSIYHATTHINIYKYRPSFYPFNAFEFAR